MSALERRPTSCSGSRSALLIAGALLLAGGVTMIVIGARGTTSAAPAAVAAPQTDGAPVAAAALRRCGRPSRSLSAAASSDRSRWLWVVKWILVIPHSSCSRSSGSRSRALGGGVLRHPLHRPLPRGIFDFNLGVLRWTQRVGFYSYSALGTDRYPPSRSRSGPTTRQPSTWPTRSGSRTGCRS